MNIIYFKPCADSVHHAVASPHEQSERIAEKTPPTKNLVDWNVHERTLQCTNTLKSELRGRSGAPQREHLPHHILPVSYILETPKMN